MNAVSTSVYWDTFWYRTWTFYVAATEIGLCCVTLPNETFDTLERWTNKNVAHGILIHDAIRVTPYIQQLEEYLYARRTVFDVPLDLKGTPFQIQVWRALLNVPFGTTQSYTEIALSIGHPNSVRAVGAANGSNPVPIIVPCHRIIGKNGALTGYRGGIDMKTQLLKLEGIEL